MDDQMEDKLSIFVSDQTLAALHEAYVQHGRENVAFAYARGLISRKEHNEIVVGTEILQGLYKEEFEDNTRWLYALYIAIAYTRMREYDRALAYLDLITDPTHMQARRLRAIIKKRMKSDGLLGIGVLGAVGTGVLVGAMVLAKLFSR